MHTPCERKVPYPSQRIALIWSKAYAIKYGDRVFPAYHCPKCHKWHLTSATRSRQLVIEEARKQAIAARRHREKVYWETRLLSKSERRKRTPKRFRNQ